MRNISSNDDVLRRVRIAAPCPVAWETMSGDERTRFCSLCSLNVFNVAGMTADDAVSLIRDTEGRLCVRLRRRPDGTLLTRDCPTGVRAMRMRFVRAATFGAAALLAFAQSSFAWGWRKKAQMLPTSPVVVTATPRSDATSARLRVTVVDESDAPLPGVWITLSRHGEAKTFVTDIAGTLPTQGCAIEQRASDVGVGTWELHAELSGFLQARQNVTLSDDTVTNVTVRLRIDPQNAVTVGIMVIDTSPLDDNGIHTHLQQRDLDKLPL